MLLEKGREQTEGGGVDVVFDCAGVQKGFNTGMDALRYKGVYMNVAAWGIPVSMLLKLFLVLCWLLVDGDAFHALPPKRDNDKVCVGVRRQRLQGDSQCIRSRSVRNFLLSQLTGFAGKFKGLETMITSRIRLDQITDQGFDQLLQHKDNHIKIMVTPRGTDV
jgi:NADPH:quinone reductase-like Zn-dependent oxidoreductase